MSETSYQIDFAEEVQDANPKEIITTKISSGPFLPPSVVRAVLPILAPLLLACSSPVLPKEDSSIPIASTINAESFREIVHFEVRNEEELEKVQEVINSSSYESDVTVEISIMPGEYNLRQKNIQISDKAPEIERKTNATAGFHIQTRGSVKITASEGAVLMTDNSCQVGLHISSEGNVELSGLRIVTKDEGVAQGDESSNSLIYIEADEEKSIVELHDLSLLHGGSNVMSGIAIRGAKQVDVISSNVQNVTWDGIVGFKTGDLTIKRVNVTRTERNLYNMGAGIAIVTYGIDNSLVYISDTDIIAFQKGIAVMDDNSGQSSSDVVLETVNIETGSPNGTIYYGIATPGALRANNCKIGTTDMPVYSANEIDLTNSQVKFFWGLREEVDPFGPQDHSKMHFSNVQLLTNATATNYPDYDWLFQTLPTKKIAFFSKTFT